jgi:hypothetical protein
MLSPDLLAFQIGYQLPPLKTLRKPFQKIRPISSL